MKTRPRARTPNATSTTKYPKRAGEGRPVLPFSIAMRPVRAHWKRGQDPFAGTARRMLRTKGSVLTPFPVSACDWFAVCMLSRVGLVVGQTDDKNQDREPARSIGGPDSGLREMSAP